MTIDQLAELQSLQDHRGCFPSIVTSGDGRRVDRNGFVTAMVLRSLRHLPDTPGWSDIRGPALNWLWSCRSTDVPGAFSFWPDDARPTWAAAIPADVDDTAVMLTELLRHGRLDRASVMRSVCHAIVPCRVGAAEVAMLPPWVVPGSFFTWIPALAPTGRSVRATTNVVDCCVNTNVVALMSQLGAQHLPGCDAATQTVLNGLQWAGDDARRLASLTPFYPSPRGLADAIEHAVECGADALYEGRQRLASVPPDVLDAGGGSCRSAYGTTIWQAPALDVARAMALASTV